MASFELPELPEARISPQMLVGAASPLWGYFGVAAAGGVAYWWMTRWTQVANLEALFGAAAKAVAAPAEMLADTAEPPPVPVGGEAAPISPLVAAMAEPVIEEPAPTIEVAREEVAAEPVAEVALEPVIEAAPEPTVEPEPEALVEAAPETEAEVMPEPAAKPRVRKATPPNGPETQH